MHLKHLPGDLPPTVAVAVVADNRQHTGLVYSDDEPVSFFLHLAFHCQLERETVGTHLSWVVTHPSLPPERLEHVAAMCGRVWQRHQGGGLPYGFRYVATRFNDEGILTLGSDERGLTCSTFVLAVFRSVGIELVRIDDWPAREDDAARFERLVARLDQDCEDKAHVEAVRQQTRAIRYRALEVAGAFSCPSPASFAAAAAVAVEIEKELDGVNSSAPSSTMPSTL